MAEDLNDAGRLRWEKRVLARARSGERAAIGEIYSEYAPMLFSRVLLPRLGDRAAAEDALSETFRMAIERLGSFEPRGVSVYFWLARIAINKATDMHRVKGTTRRALASFDALLAPLREPTDSPEEQLSGHIERGVLQAAVERGLAELNPRYRRAIELRFVEQRTRQECADLLEVKLGTFDVLLLRALRAFRRAWEARAEAGS